MASTITTPFTITYCRDGTQPPVYLAGDFTTPEWEPLEMDSAVSGDGNHLFESHISIELGRKYHFKFKVGDNDSWSVEENYSTATDSLGDPVNVIKVNPGQDSAGQLQALRGATKLNTRYPEPRESASPKGGVAKIKGGEERRSSTPIEQVAKVAAEVADTAAQLDAEESSPPLASVSGGESEIEEDLKTPLFAHECFGAYEFVDDALDHHAYTETKPRRDSAAKSIDYALHEVDTNDPTIERFPLDKSSIFDTLRKIQSSLGEDPVSLEDSSTSSRHDSRRASSDSDDSLLSAGSLSSTTTKRRENRMSTSSGRNKPMVSLGAIAEEPKAGER